MPSCNWLGCFSADPGAGEQRNSGKASAQQKASGKDGYEYVGDLGAGRKGEIKLMRNRKTQELVAVKYVPRVAGVGLTKNTEREIVNHRKLLHPNIIRFKEVFYDDQHLAIVMEYASEGHLSNRMKLNGRLPEDDARRFFQQLIDGVFYCHQQGIVHRDLRLEHLLLDGNYYKPTLKITGFGYSKSEILDSQPKSCVGSPTYTPPEVLMSRDAHSYDGKAMDIWACGVILFLMLTGTYPFQDSKSPGVLTRRMMQNVMRGKFSWPKLPPGQEPSEDVKDLVKRLLQPEPAKRANMEEIMQHRWVATGYHSPRKLGQPALQTEEDIARIVQQAKIIPEKRRSKRLADGQYNEDEIWLD